ncbi:uncharacterized protein G2W53_019169 [Senna tora]|uniref:Uncharacterized protein n=1 Tax=Senna tora TaxID=362788 RepID=A0A834WLR7_9FABA|nr:uncharacterized protein G2W53_019169 [Senna tora]
MALSCYSLIWEDLDPKREEQSRLFRRRRFPYADICETSDTFNKRLNIKNNFTNDILI